MIEHIREPPQVKSRVAKKEIPMSEGLQSHALQWIPLPSGITNTEDLGKWLTTDGQGMAVDLGGKSLQPKGGYEKEAYGLTWTEHPHPHWHMNFMGGNTRLRNGTIVLIDRLALTIEGPAVTLENMTFEGQGDPASDSRCAVILKGAATCATLSNVTFKSLGAYVWEDADATIRDCSFHGGLHGVYAWGKCKVEVASCKISGTEKSGVCIREGCALVMTGTASSAAKTGSGLWVGPKSVATVSDCSLTENEAYGVESSYEQAKAELKNCTLTGNGKAETDTWKGGQVSVA